MYKNIELLCGSPETNIILYVSYTSIEKKKAADSQSIAFSLISLRTPMLHPHPILPSLFLLIQWGKATQAS